MTVDIGIYLLFNEYLKIGRKRVAVTNKSDGRGLLQTGGSR